MIQTGPTAGLRDREAVLPSEKTSVALSPLRLLVQGGDGKTQTIEFFDVSEAEAVRRVVSRGLRVLVIESAELARKPAAGSKFPLVLFSQELLALLEAGLNLTEALTTLVAKERQPVVRDVIARVLEILREGRSFSDVLELSPQYFPEVYVATVRAAERTGDMPRALSRYIAYQQQFDEIRKKLVSAAIYPAMLLVVGGFVTLFLLGYVVPKFSAVYESAGRDVPWMSMLLLSFGKQIHQHWQLALGGVLALFGGFAWGLSQHQVRMRLLDLLLRLPGVSVRADEFRLARFYRATSLLLASGIALSRALGMVNGLLSEAQQKRLKESRLAIEQGQSLSVALIGCGLASPVAESLIKVGERTGQMSEMLERTARFHDSDFARWVDWGSRLLEPLLMAFIGVVVGTVVVLMYMPIFELAGSLQ